MRRTRALERNVAGQLRSRYADVAAPPGPRAAFRAQECKVRSQNGEDGLLLHVFGQIGATDRRLVEIGIGDGSECNAANLLLEFGWTGLLVDRDPEGIRSARRFYDREEQLPPERVRIVEHLVTAENVDALLVEHGFEGEIDLLSIDIDSNDYWIWKAIRSVEPRVVVIEYNASLGCREPRITLYQPDFDRWEHHPRGWYHGASLPALARVGEQRGYALVGCDSTGVNAFFVRKTLLRGELEALSPEEAWYPDLRRLRRASAAEQLRTLERLPFTADAEDG